MCSSRDTTAGAKRSNPVPTWPAAVASDGPSARRAARTRRSLNDPMHTRAVAACRLIVSTVGASAESALMSMLSRVVGNSSSSSVSSGTASVPLIRASRTAAYGRSRIAPSTSVTRSRWVSWKATSSPSDVACTSVSR